MISLVGSGKRSDLTKNVTINKDGKIVINNVTIKLLNQTKNYFLGFGPNLFLPLVPSCINKTKTYKPIIGINDNSTNQPDLLES